MPLIVADTYRFPFGLKAIPFAKPIHESSFCAVMLFTSMP